MYTAFGSAAQMQQAQSKSGTMCGGGPKPTTATMVSTPSPVTPSRGQMPAPSEAAKMIDDVLRSLESMHRQNQSLLQGLLAALQQVP